MYHNTCMTYVPLCMLRLLTTRFLSSRWRGKCSWHSRCMRNPQFCISGKRPMESGRRDSLETWRLTCFWLVDWSRYQPLSADLHGFSHQHIGQFTELIYDIHLYQSPRHIAFSADCLMPHLFLHVSLITCQPGVLVSSFDRQLALTKCPAFSQGKHGLSVGLI